jgi:myo-inositol-1-phosphate synthase
VLYAAPSGRPETAHAYAEAALRAGAAFINTTSDAVARDRHWLDRFTAAGLPLLGDDLASQFGTSVVHHALLRLLEERGLSLISSYQVNLGGTEDFKNLVENSNTKLQSKLNALAADTPTADPSWNFSLTNPLSTSAGADRHIPRFQLSAALIVR